MSRARRTGKSSELERALYAGAKRALTAYIRQADDNFPIALEVTADTMPQGMQTLVRDEVLFLLSNDKLRPDIFGEIGPNATEMYGRSRFTLTAEVKPNPITIRDVLQAKMYGELYSAHVALIMSPKLPKQTVVRLLELRPDLLSYSAGYERLYVCSYSEKEESINWWLGKDQPRRRK